MRLLGVTLLSMALSAVLVADPECEQTLDRSMSLTDTCLRELQVYKVGGKVENSQILEQLHNENEQLSRENKQLREKIGKASSGKSKKKKHSTSCYKKYGKQLANQNRGVVSAKLIDKGLYRIETQMSNMRDEPTSGAAIAAVGNKGEVYPFSKIIAKSAGNGEVNYWVKGDLGWMYVTNSKTPDVNKVLKRKAEFADKKDASAVNEKSKKNTVVKHNENSKPRPTI